MVDVKGVLATSVVFAHQVLHTGSFARTVWCLLVREDLHGCVVDLIVSVIVTRRLMRDVFRRCLGSHKEVVMSRQVGHVVRSCPS